MTDTATATAAAVTSEVAGAATYTTKDSEAALAWVGQTYAGSGPAMTPRGDQNGFRMTNTTLPRGPLTSVEADFATGLSWEFNGGVGGLALTTVRRGHVEARMACQTTRVTTGESLI